MFVDDSAVRAPDVAPGPHGEEPAELSQPTGRHAARRQRIVRALTILVVYLGAVGVVVALARLRARGRRSAPVSSPPTPIVKARSVLLRAALSAIDLRRRPPHGDTPTGRLAEAVRSLRCPPVPRVLPYVTVKRTNPRVGDTFGHWWVEVDGAESYGWWPDRCPIRVRDFLFGTSGGVNGLGGSCVGGTAMTDPHHREPAQHAFHPKLVVRKSDRRVRRDLRAFAQAFTGEWRYSTKPTSNDCRSFQLRLLHAAGLEEPSEHAHTRGTGCPFLSLFRTRVREFAAGRDGWNSRERIGL